jgi:hypothetical protein
MCENNLGNLHSYSRVHEIATHPLKTCLLTILTLCERFALHGDMSHL